MATHRVYLGLGSNQGNRQELILESIRLLQKQVGTLCAQSAFFETQPWGFVSEHLFLNAAVSLSTELTPLQLLRTTQAIERQLGRTQKSSGGQYHDRTIDIDILLYDDLVLHSRNLQIPHPHILERTFVLNPLSEIAPNLIHPLTGLPMSAY